MPLPQDFINWITPANTNLFWNTLVPAQQVRLDTNGLFLQFFKSHSDANIPTYLTEMPNYIAGRKVPDSVIGKPSDVSESWSDVFPSKVSDLLEAQYQVNIGITPTGHMFEVATRIKFDNQIWQVTPILEVPYANVDSFIQATTPEQIIPLVTITNEGWVNVS